MWSNRDAMSFLSTCKESLTHVDAFKKMEAKRYDARIIIFRCMARWTIYKRALELANIFVDEHGEDTTRFAFALGVGQAVNRPTVVCDGCQRCYQTVFTMVVDQEEERTFEIELSFLNDWRNLKNEIDSDMGGFIEDGSLVSII